MRREDWQPRLRAEIARAAVDPFEWGRTDCCMFAARCVDAVTGSAWEAELRARYHDKAGALRFLAEEGGLEAAVTRRFGPPVPWMRAMRGDLVLLPSEDGLGSLGICMGATTAAVLPEGGIHHAPTKAALACWNVR